MSATSTQVGGTHYKDMPIQPIEFITKNKLGYIEGCILKYICRHRAKNGREDLEKAKHYIEMLMEMEYPDEWRTLAVGEIAESGDEVCIDGKWEPVDGMIGYTVKPHDAGDLRRPTRKATP